MKKYRPVQKLDFMRAIWSYIKRPRATVAFGIWLLLIVSVSPPTSQSSFNQLVKTTNTYWTFDPNRSLSVFNFDCKITNFTPQSPSVQISPLSNDPGMVTQSPMALQSPTDEDGDGLLDGPFLFTLNSLKDLGTWTITCNGTWVDPANPNSVTPWLEPTNFQITVFNNPPTANITHSPTPVWNQPLTLKSNASDPDAGPLTFRWSIVEKPPESSLNLNATQTENNLIMFFTNDNDIGDWKIQLDVDDNEGERKTFTHEFTVPNVKPSISIEGETSIDVLETIDLQVTPVTDVDGGNLDIVWDLEQSPPGAQYAPQSNFATGPDLPLIVTKEQDIGEWRFKATATDNEGDSDEKEVTVEVKNLPPEINLVGSGDIDIGDPIDVETSVIEDVDGGLLNFKWDIIQAPQSASLTVQEAFLSGTGSEGSSLHINTTPSYAGTWIFRLTATDNDEAPNSEVSKKFTVLVDAPPEAVIACTTCADPASQDQGIIGSSSFPLVLDGSGSIDPDSPPPPPCPGSEAEHCHDTLDGRTPDDISTGIASFLWSVIDVPSELLGDYALGPVDEVFGVTANLKTLTFTSSDLKPGDWTFQLHVWDGEGNESQKTFRVTVVDESGPPLAIASAPARYTTDLSGILDEDIVISGRRSIDPDNILDLPAGGELEPGAGITNYHWDILSAPTGCTPLPVLPNGPAAKTVTLFTQDTVIDPKCEGTWQIGLTVTDDDSSPKTDSTETSVIIGNCPQAICIDYPTNLNHQVVEFTKNTDISIYYHLDSALLDDPLFKLGSFSKLEIFHESDLDTPLYTATDANLLASDKGSLLVFHWNGFSNTSDRLQSGKYTINITLYGSKEDPNLGGVLVPSPFTTTESEAIWIEVVQPSILSTSDKYVNYDKLKIGAVSVHLNYHIEGTSLPDDLCWDVTDQAANSLITNCISSPGSIGTIDWDGLIGGLTIPTGNYTVTLEAFRAGVSLDVSDPYPLTIYRLALTPSTGPVSDTPPGLFVFVNSDDDNLNNISDLTEVTVAGENDLVKLTVTVEPSMEGDLTLSSTNSAPFKLWNPATAPALEMTLPATFNLPAQSVPPQLFMEGQAVGQTNLRLEFQTSTGVILDPTTIALTMLEVEVMIDKNNDFVIGPGDERSYFVRPGLWDFAFRMVADAFGGIGTLFNEEDETRLAAVGNPENFVGRDGNTRRFYFRISNPAANANPAGRDEIHGNFSWFTVKANLTDDDHPPTDASLTLIETGNNTGIFVSRAVMLVPDQVDRNQGTNTGITAHLGIAMYDQANHRTRQVSGPDGLVVGRYFPAGVGGPQFDLFTPLFQRNPEERRVLNVHVFNFSDTTNLGIPAIPQGTINSTLQVISELYTPAGIRVNVIFNPASDVINLPAGSPVNLNMVAPFGGGFGTLAPSADQTNLISLVRAVDPAAPANADIIYLIFVGQFTNGDRGESFPDGWLPAGSTARNFVFVAGRAPQIDYVGAHEIGHMLTNETLSAAEANGTAPGWAGGGHYGGPQDQFNFMERSGTMVTMPRQVTNSKRLWDDTIVHLVRQIQRIRQSRYLKMP